MGILSSQNKHRASDDVSKLPKKLKKVKAKKQADNNRQAKVVDQKTDKKRGS